MATKPKSRLASIMKSKIGGNDEVQKVRSYIDTGVPQLNEIVSGDMELGIPSGRIVLIEGGSSVGKTWIATEMMIHAQQKGGVAVFLDHENSFDVELAKKNGLDTNEDNGNYIYKHPQTFEKSVETMGIIIDAIRGEELIDPEAPIVIVVDSLASMVPLQKYAKTDHLKDGKGGKNDEFNMNDNTALARCTSSWFPTIAQWCREYNCTVIFLNQIRSNVGVMFGDKITAPGGQAPIFYASVRIRLSASAIKDSDKGKIGQTVTACCIKNKISQPLLTCQWNYYYDVNRGLDRHESLLDYMIERGYVEKSGRNIIIDGKPTTKAFALASLRKKSIKDIVASLKASKPTKEIKKSELEEDDIADDF